VQERGHRDMRIAGHGIAQRQRPVCGQFADEAIRQRLDDIVLVRLRFSLLANRDNRAPAGGGAAPSLGFPSPSTAGTSS